MAGVEARWHHHGQSNRNNEYYNEHRYSEQHKHKNGKSYRGSQNGPQEGESGPSEGGEQPGQHGGSPHQGGSHYGTHMPHKPIKRANAILRIFEEGEIQGGASNAVVTFTQEQEHGPVSVRAQIMGLGLGPNSLRGWHVHESGDLTNGCGSAGLHFNPQGQNHGAPWDPERHVGDLGNMQTDENGDAFIVDEVINDRMSLNGYNSIIGRVVIVHLGTDDLGLGGKPDSLTVGASGPRLACGIVGILPDEAPEAAE
ncbi:hypothetical protein FA15DRAFT_752206 [Coprinopsis marcescibilis]|uniref:Superoxide dismutase copper/zinc binding domain-containing protein n=1 Tax=Coprinopsis marcescibilis TaxID=230819 RepID=A0A5C3LCC6_COPMA|nr:hypothetical protein FA15DRAFT_752206 [Coprinopsis marcescibilis]